MPGSKNVLKKIDYDKIKIQEVHHLPPRFDGTRLFVLLGAKVSSSQTRAKSLDGMDKQYECRAPLHEECPQHHGHKGTLE